MGLWERASGALKDQNRIWLAIISRPTALHHPEIEATIIRATTHLESSLDRPTVERACEYVLRSPNFNLKPFLWSLTNRVEKTRSWVVALKGLHLLHTFINTKFPGVDKIGNLPFNLANFVDRRRRAWPFNVFVRQYYAFLDHKSTLLYETPQMYEREEEGAGEKKDKERRRSTIMAREIVLLKKLQASIDLLIQIRPQNRASSTPLILDVMEDVIVEILSVYDRICRGIAAVLENISVLCSAGKLEAMVALDTIQKAALQGEQLSVFLEYCQMIGVVNAGAAHLSFFDNQFPVQGIEELEKIVYGISEKSTTLDQNGEKCMKSEADVEEKMDCIDERKERSLLRTVITDKWERFDEDCFMPNNPFLLTHGKYIHVPDLISF